MCGRPLCATCKHDYTTGRHITKEAADEQRRIRKKEKDACIASRTSPDRRMNDELGVPLNLFELLKGDWRADGFELRTIYYLVLDHHLMGQIPAILSSDEERIIFTVDLQLLERVWHSIDQRPAKLRSVTAYVNVDLGIAYLESERSKEREGRRAERLLTSAEYKALVGEATGHPFVWARGLIGGRTLGYDDFHRALAKQAKALDPTFESAFA